MKLTTDEIINMLGGVTATSKIFNISTAAVSKWKELEYLALD